MKVRKRDHRRRRRYRRRTLKAWYREWIAAGGPMMHLFGEPLCFSEILRDHLNRLEKRKGYGGRKGRAAKRRLGVETRDAHAFML